MTEEVKAPSGENTDLFPEEKQTPDGLAPRKSLDPEIPEENQTGKPSAAIPACDFSDIKEYPKNPLKKNKAEKDKKRNRFPAVLLTILLMMPLTAVLFVAGLLIGGEYGISSKKVEISKIPFIETVKRAIDKTTAVPLSLTVTEQQVNDAISESPQDFSPMKNMNVTIQGDTCIFSGQITTADMKPIVGETVPEMLYLFLPETLNLKAEFGVSSEDATRPKIKSLLILNMDQSEELVKGLGLDTYLETMVQDKLTQAVPAQLEVSAFRIEDGKILCATTLNLLKE